MSYEFYKSLYYYCLRNIGRVLWLSRFMYCRAKVLSYRDYNIMNLRVFDLSSFTSYCIAYRIIYDTLL